MITELVKFKVLESTTKEQFLSKAELLIDFHKNVNGYLDCELVKGVNENSWYFIYHYESLEKIMVAGQELRKSIAFNEIMSLLEPDSVKVSFHEQLKKW